MSVEYIPDDKNAQSFPMAEGKVAILFSLSHEDFLYRVVRGVDKETMAGYIVDVSGELIGDVVLSKREQINTIKGESGYLHWTED